MGKLGYKGLLLLGGHDDVGGERHKLSIYVLLILWREQVPVYN